MDKASNYFLMTEMMRGMWVVLEQFFRPPYVALHPSMGDGEASRPIASKRLTTAP